MIKGGIQPDDICSTPLCEVMGLLDRRIVLALKDGNSIPLQTGSKDHVLVVEVLLPVGENVPMSWFSFVDGHHRDIQGSEKSLKSVVMDERRGDLHHHVVALLKDVAKLSDIFRHWGCSGNVRSPHFLSIVEVVKRRKCKRGEALVNQGLIDRVDGGSLASEACNTDEFHDYSSGAATAV